MARKTAFQRFSIERLVAVGAVSISVIFLVAFGGQILEIYRLRGQLVEAERRLDKLRADRVALIATQTRVASDAYARQVARAELNKIQPGDRSTNVDIVRPAPAPTPAPTPEAQAPQPGPPYFREWWQLLFGD